jgi:hypothetical protein
MKKKLKKDDYITTEQLINCGWKFSHCIGNLEMWVQSNEALLYNTKSGKVEGVYQT